MKLASRDPKLRISLSAPTQEMVDIRMSEKVSKTLPNQAEMKQKYCTEYVEFCSKKTSASKWNLTDKLLHIDDLWNPIFETQDSIW